MSNLAVMGDQLETDTRQRVHITPLNPDVGRSSDGDLSAAITKAASKQTYYTIRLLADRDRVEDAYRAYAYFRWVDDSLDTSHAESAAQQGFVQRQQSLICEGYQGRWPADLTVEETMLKRLIRTDSEPNTGLFAYIQHMMAVMTFDAGRRGRLISHQDLTDYTLHLAVGVTEAMHYFIGHDDPTPRTETRYHAVIGAHITHMLRDTYEDIAAGYFNIPCEVLSTHRLTPSDVQADAYREWVKQRVQLARAYFDAGKEYLARITNWRCRLAGYAYMARFNGVLDAIEREGYRLRPTYPERKRFGGLLKMCWAMLDGLCFPAWR